MGQTNDTQYASRLAVTEETRLKAAILKTVNYEGFKTIGELISYLVDDAWMDAKGGGLVTDAMLQGGKRKAQA